MATSRSLNLSPLSKMFHSFRSVKSLNTILTIVILVLCVHRGDSATAATNTILLNLSGQGKILGNYDSTAWTQQVFMQFRGIPYAESPTGPLRFKAPLPRQPWSSYLDATKWGRRCPVITTISKLSPTELSEDLEDCLNLCVYTKNLTAKVPVMVYIHGGGFYNGTSLDHPPKYLMEKDIVLVVPQYRIGALGFTSTQTDEIPGNAAIADTLLALQWVQQHIAAFGGDPTSVTVFGQSAGAALIGALLASPITPHEYFHRALMQSGSVLGAWAKVANPKMQAARICRSLNCVACEELENINECLMNANVKDLMDSTKDEYLAPTIGDKWGILPEHPVELFKKYNKPVTIMTGFTKHDGSYMLGVYYDQFMQATGGNVTTVRQFIEPALPVIDDPTSLVSNLETRLFFKRAILDSTDHDKALPGYFDLFNVQYFKSPAVALTSTLLPKNLGKVYFYTFDYGGEHTRFGYEMGNDHYPFNGGIHHSNDNIYAFNTHPLNARDTEVSKKVIAFWTSFAINGQPYGDDQVTIPHMETPSGPYFHINEETTIGYDIFDEFTVTMDDPENYKLLRSNKS